MFPGPDSIVTALTLGLLGTGHCLAMCGGIAGALGMRGNATSTPGLAAQSASALPLQAAGRLSSYAALGALAGGVGAVAADLVPAAALLLRALAGALLVAMGLYLAGLWRGLLHLERFGSGLFAAGRLLAARVEGPAEPLAFGMAWGLLPCGLVYTTLAWSLSAGSAPGGALLMLAFGLGTLPATTGAALLAAPLGELLLAPATRRAAGAAVIAFGFWTLLSGGVLVSAAIAAEQVSPGSDAVATFDCHGSGTYSALDREDP
jgi:sulfite exporter TauE/SafE